MTGKLLSTEQAQRALGLAIYLHGNRCKYCGRSNRKLELDHVDGEPTNNPPDGSNWAPSCGPCNKEKGPHRGPGKRGAKLRSILDGRFRDGAHRKPPYERESERERESEEESVRSISAEMKKNQECEPTFREYVLRLVREVGEINYRDLLMAGCEHANVSDQTGKRYLGKLLSLAGTLDYFKTPEGIGCVRMKPGRARQLEGQGNSQQGTVQSEE